MEKEDMISIREYEDRKTEERGWTDAFSAAVTRMESEGGGTLVVPAGRYETFPIELKHNKRNRKNGIKICNLGTILFFSTPYFCT